MKRKWELISLGVVAALVSAILTNNLRAAELPAARGPIEAQVATAPLSTGEIADRVGFAVDSSTTR